MTARPRYRIARFMMELTAVVGAILIIASLTNLIHNHLTDKNLVEYLLSFGLAVNGLAVVAASQMGNATIDTAISTRETANAVASLVSHSSRSENLGKSVQALSGKVIRAER